MKKILVVLMLLVLLVCNSSVSSHASTSIPTAQWDLRLTAYMEQIGIFTDPANHRGYYDYSALISSNYTRYSDYYFKAQANKRYYLHGYEVYSINQPYYVVLENKFETGQAIRQVAAAATYFIYDYGNCQESIKDQAYFYFNATNGSSGSINGHIETY